MLNKYIQRDRGSLGSRRIGISYPILLSDGRSGQPVFTRC
jgi:hypothetical protein